MHPGWFGIQGKPMQSFQMVFMVNGLGIAFLTSAPNYDTQ